MPNPQNVKALKTFESKEEADIYAAGCQAGLNHAPYGCSHPDPVRVRKETDALTGVHSVYIEWGRYDGEGNIIFD